MLASMNPGEPGRTSLRVRLGIVALVFLVMVLMAVGLSTLMIRSWDRTVDRRGDARMAADDVAELKLAFSDQETGIRGYLLSPEPEFLEPYRDASAVERRIATRLDDRNLDVPGFHDQLGRVLATGERWRTTVAEPVIADVDNAPDEDVAQAAFDEVRTELDGLDAMVTDELAQLDQEASRTRRSLFGVLFASALTAILGTALAATLFRRWVIQPLAAIGDAARSLIRDDTHPLPHFEAPELQDVSDAVGSLQRSLRSARDEALSALEGIEQSAVLAIQVRSELADEIGDMPDGWSAHTLLVPAEGFVAGDCFDIGLLDANRLYVVLIDVTGHGASAALNALKAKSQLRAALRSRLDPGSSIDWLSREMLKDDRSDLLTTTVLIVQLDTGRIRYASAGHPPVLLTDGESVRALDETGPLVGAFAASWTTAVADIPPGWTLLMHTDGITDTIGAQRERFGEQRLQACMTEVDPVVLLDRIHTAVERFRVGARSDDLTAIAVHRITTAPIELPADDTMQP